MLDAGYWMLDADRIEGERGRPGEREKENRDAGYRMLDTRFWMLKGIGFRV